MTPGPKLKKWRVQCGAVGPKSKKWAKAPDPNSKRNGLGGVLVPAVVAVGMDKVLSGERYGRGHIRLRVVANAICRASCGDLARGDT